MTEEYGDIPDGFFLSQKEIDELRKNKQSLTKYGQEKIRKLMKNQEPKEMTAGQLMDTEKFQEEFYKDHINHIKNKKMTKIAQKCVAAARNVTEGGVPLGKLIREGHKDPMSARVNCEYAAVLREVVEQCRVGGMVYCADILELADELETLKELSTENSTNS